MSNKTIAVMEAVRKENPYLVPVPFVNKQKKPAAKEWTTKGSKYKLRSNCITYGFSTALSGLIIIDADNHEGKESGTEKLKPYLQENNYQAREETLVVASPNRGIHVYFKLPEGVEAKNSSSGTFMGESVDIRASGGCIVGPGSLMTKEDGSTGEYKIISKTLKIAEAPDFIIRDFINNAPEKAPKSRRTKKAPSKVATDTSSLTLETPEERASFCLSKTASSKIPESAKVSTIRKVKESFELNFTEGKRHTTLNSLSFQLGLVAIPEDQAREALKLDSRAVYSNWDENPDEVFLTAYIDGLGADYSSEGFLTMRRLWNKEQGLSNYKDPLLPEFSSNLGLAEKISRVISDKYIIDKEGLLYRYDPKKNYWKEEDKDSFEAKIINYIKGPMTDLILDEYPGQLSYYNSNKIFSLSSTDIRAIISFVNKDLVLSSPKPYKDKPNLFLTKSHLVNFKNKKYRNIKEKDFVTKKLPLRYRPELLEGPSNEIVECLLSCIPEPCRSYFLLSLGQAITGNYSDKIVALIGPPNVGKTALLEAVEKVIGSDYSELVSSSIFDSRNTRGFERARLEGKRYVRLEEFTGLSKSSTQDTINSLIDTAVLEGERKGKDSKKFKNQVSFFYSANRLPSISSSKNSGFYRRFTPIACEKGKIYSKGNLKKAFDESKEAQEYLLALIIDNAFKVYEDNSVLNNLPREITELKEKWVEGDSLAPKIMSAIIPTGYKTDLIFSHDLIRLLEEEHSVKVNLSNLRKEFSEDSLRSKGLEYSSGKRVLQTDKVSKSLYFKKSELARPSFIRGAKFKEELEG